MEYVGTLIREPPIEEKFDQTNVIDERIAMDRSEPFRFKEGDRIRHKGFEGRITAIKDRKSGMIEWDNGSMSLVNLSELHLAEPHRAYWARRRNDSE